MLSWDVASRDGMLSVLLVFQLLWNLAQISLAYRVAQWYGGPPPPPPPISWVQTTANCIYMKPKYILKPPFDFCEACFHSGIIVQYEL